MNRFLIPTALVLLASAIPAAAQPKSEQDELDNYLSGVADDVVRFLQSRGESRIAIHFSPLTGSSTAGVGYTQVLADKLKKQRIEVAPSARFTFRGEFGPGEGPRRDAILTGRSGDAIGLKLNGKIVDGFGKQVLDSDFSGLIHDDRKLGEALGASVADLHKAREPDAMKQAIRKAIEDPNIIVAGNREARAGDRSLFAVEVLVKGQPLTLRKENGQATFALDVNDEYELRIINRSSFEVSVGIAIDGLNVFHFAEEVNPVTNRPYRCYVIPAASGGQPGLGVISGWFKTSQRVTSFKAVPAEESLAARLGRTAEIGQITVTFHASWDETVSRPPADEPGRQLALSPPPRVLIPAEPEDFPSLKGLRPIPVMQRIGTGEGSDRATNARGVARTIGVVRDVVTLRYVGKKE